MPPHVFIPMLAFLLETDARIFPENIGNCCFKELGALVGATTIFVDPNPDPEHIASVACLSPDIRLRDCIAPFPCPCPCNDEAGIKFPMDWRLSVSMGGSTFFPDPDLQQLISQPLIPAKVLCSLWGTRLQGLRQSRSRAEITRACPAPYRKSFHSQV